MREEESNDNDLEGRLRDYFRAEDQEFESPQGLWESLSPRLGEQRRTGWRRRLLAASKSIPFWAPDGRKALVVAMVLVVAVGLGYLGVSLATDDEAEQYQASRPAATTVNGNQRSYAADRAVPYEEHGGTEAPVDGGPIAVSAVGETLAFDTNIMTAESGSEVTITFTNASSFNQHNLVIVEAGTKDAVANDGIAAGPDNHWIPQGDSRVIASTVLIGPGETGDVTFTAPAPGTYQFVCTFPGHNFTMFGDFIFN